MERKYSEIRKKLNFKFQLAQPSGVGDQKLSKTVKDAALTDRIH
jgi:hypothetical protein